MRSWEFLSKLLYFMEAEDNGTINKVYKEQTPANALYL
jgi:hypothetical protein